MGAVAALVFVFGSLCAFAQSLGPFSLPWAFMPTPIGGPALSVGYVNVKTNFNIDFVETPFLFSRGNSTGGPNYKQSYSGFKTRGLWLSGAQSFALGDALRLVFDAGVMIPSANHDSNVFVNQDTSNPGFPYTYNLTTSTKTTWWNLDGELRCNYRNFGQFLVGLRYDDFDAKSYDFSYLALLINPTVPVSQALFAVSIPQLEGYSRFRTLIPYLGLENSYGTGYGEITAKFIFAPWVRTRVEGKQTQPGYSYGLGPVISQNGAVGDRYELDLWARKGWFYEFLLRYDCRLSDSGKLGLYVKWSQLQGSFDGSILLKTRRVTPGNILDLGGDLPAPSVFLNRYGFNIGGTCSLAFSLPFL